MNDLEIELARVADREPVVRAWVTRHDDDYLRSAHSSLPPGPLQGWSLGVKDVIDTADLPTQRGSSIYAGRTTTNDAPCVALARLAGAQVSGKTHTTEFALFSPTVTTNPHNPDHTPGGSSSGSAAAVADGMVRAAFGTQTVGSVIRPAAFCGVVGFKPTYQLIPTTGVATLAHSFDTVGWMTRSVADAQAMFEAMTGFAVGAAAPGARARSNSTLRLGRYRSHQWHAAQPEMAGVLDGVADRLADAGADVVDVEPLPHLDGLFESADLVLHYEISRVFRWERDHHEDQISPLVRKMLGRADDIGFEDYIAARAAMQRSRRAHHEYLAAAGFDALVTPSAPGEAPLMATTGDSVFNRVWTSLGVPALHLPTGAGPLGLPVGVQLVGSTLSDAELLLAGAAIEAMMIGAPA